MEFPALTQGMLAGLGEAVTVHVTAGSPAVTTDTDLTACYRGPWTGVTEAGVMVEREAHELLFPTDDELDTDGVTVVYPGVSPLGIKTGDQITRAGVLFDIVDIAPDDGGMTSVKIQKAPA
jgi:hypothetical protein